MTEPSDTVELIRAEWADLLGVADPDEDDDFFALGGHSLLLLKLTGRLRETLRRDVPAHRLLAEPTVAGMAAVLDQLGAAHPSPTTVSLAVRAVPTSVWQARALELARQGDGTVPAAVAFTLGATGKPNPPQVEAALRSLVRGHSALRTYFPGSGTLLARCAAAGEVDCPVTVVDLSGPDRVDAERRALAELRASFEPSSPPLIRAALLVRPVGYRLAIAASDLVMDPWSVPAFQACLVSGTTTLSDFIAFAAAERKWIASAPGQRALDRWVAGWQERGPAPLLPFPPLPNPSAGPAHEERALSPDALRHNAELCRALRVTPFTMLITATLLALRDLTGQPDPGVLLHLARRDDPHLAGAIGPYQNVAPVRVALEPSWGVAEAAALVRDAVPGDAVPYESVAERIAQAPQVALRLLRGRPGLDRLDFGRSPAPIGLNLIWPTSGTGAAVLRCDHPGEWAGEVATLLDAVVGLLDPC